MTTPQKVTPALYKFMLELLDDKLVRVEGSSFWYAPAGNAGIRVARHAAAMEVITLHEDKIATVDKPKIRELVKQYDRGTLPHGVTITTGFAVMHKGVKIGEVGRTGAGRGQKVRYYGRAGRADEIDVPGTYADRVQAGRAICKALGMALPGEAVS